MKISRRNFLGAATASAAGAILFRPRLDSAGTQTKCGPNCVVLDLKSHCVLRESLRGYQAALGDKDNYVSEAMPDSRRGCRMAIVPALGSADSALMRGLLNLVESGTDVLVESGAGFLGEGEFAAHQEMLHRYFEIAVQRPVDLWSGNSAEQSGFAPRPGARKREAVDRRESVPYVDYVWPCGVRVRDFTRAVPVSASAREVIGRVGLLPVALKKRLGNGTLIFLGSPLGPALNAGDLEAWTWLRLVAAPNLG